MSNQPRCTRLEVSTALQTGRKQHALAVVNGGNGAREAQAREQYFFTLKLAEDALKELNTAKELSKGIDEE